MIALSNEICFLCKSKIKKYKYIRYYMCATCECCKNLFWTAKDSGIFYIKNNILIIDFADKKYLTVYLYDLKYLDDRKYSQDSFLARREIFSIEKLSSLENIIDLYNEIETKVLFS